MELKQYLDELGPEGRAAFANRCGAAVGHLLNVAGGHKRCGEGLAINIERESGGIVKCESLRSDVDWAYLRGNSLPTPSIATKSGTHG